MTEKLEHADPSRYSVRVTGNTSSNAECEHTRHMPTFDEVAARGLSADTVRQLWPRYMGQCEDCGQHVILYASFMHYISGDW